MRHRVKGIKLSRTASHRKATLRALSTALLKHKKIRTTLAKAKATKMFVEPLITKAKNDTVHARRLVAREIHDREILQELFGEIIEKIGERKGGYTRIVKLGTRPGDGSDMAILELVDYNLGEDVKPKKKSTAKEEPKVEETEVVEDTTEVKEEAKAEAEEAEVVTEEKTEEPVSEEKAEETVEEPAKDEKAEDSTEEEKKEKE